MDWDLINLCFAIANALLFVANGWLFVLNRKAQRKRERRRLLSPPELRIYRRDRNGEPLQ